jgi:hypothetical protein
MNWSMSRSHTFTSWVRDAASKSGALGSTGTFHPKMESVWNFFEDASVPYTDIDRCGFSKDVLETVFNPLCVYVPV